MVAVAAGAFMIVNTFGDVTALERDAGCDKVRPIVNLLSIN
jgi:hypothetical protein